EPIPSCPSDESVKEIKTDKLQEQLDILIQLEFVLDEAGPTHHEERFPLSLGSDAQGRAIVAHRNPDTADSVATLIPGTTTDWQSIEEQANRGQNLAEVAHRVDENADHSVISWIGYDAPNMEVQGRASVLNVQLTKSVTSKRLCVSHIKGLILHTTRCSTTVTGALSSVRPPSIRMRGAKEGPFPVMPTPSTSKKKTYHSTTWDISLPVSTPRKAG